MSTYMSTAATRPFVPEPKPASPTDAKRTPSPPASGVTERRAEEVPTPQPASARRSIFTTDKKK